MTCQHNAYDNNLIQNTSRGCATQLTSHFVFFKHMESQSMSDLIKMREQNITPCQQRSCEWLIHKMNKQEIGLPWVDQYQVIQTIQDAWLAVRLPKTQQSMEMHVHKVKLSHENNAITSTSLMNTAMQKTWQITNEWLVVGGGLKNHVTKHLNNTQETMKPGAAPRDWHWKCSYIILSSTILKPTQSYLLDLLNLLVQTTNDFISTIRHLLHHHQAD